MTEPLVLVWRDHLAADWAADLDLTAEVPGMTAVVIRIIDVAGGTTLVYRSRALPTTDETLTTMAVDDELKGAFTAIDSTTDLTRIRVGYADSALPKVGA